MAKSGFGWLTVFCVLALTAVPVLAADAPAETSPAPAAAAEEAAPAQVASAPATLEVAEIAIAKGVENREAVDSGDTFPADVAKLYCWTKLTGGKEGDSITHRWLKDGEVMGEVSLNVNASPWRTYSSKAIMPEWKGKWSVEVLQNGTVLKSQEFTIE
ncbi:MAG: DUF2914 domain-containing protein [candidate division FCPU426 bacterium]